MGAKGEALAKQFEAKVQEATAEFEKIGDADWKKVTSAEKWPVGVVAHHVAMAHAGIGGMVKAIADGKMTAVATRSMSDIDAMNAQHAKDFASVGKAETIALQKKNAAEAAAIVRGLSDEQLGRSGNLLSGLPAMTTEQAIAGILINHMTDHLASIRATTGH